MPGFLPAVTPASLSPGTVVSVWVFPFYRHKGIVSDRFIEGLPMVISNSARAGGVTEEPWDVFAAGQSVSLEGFPGNLPPYLVVHRARSLVGKSYELFTWNCDHLALYAHGQKPESPQLVGTVAALVLGGIMLAAARAR